MGKKWAISVQDFGVGMSKKVIKKSTEPFYTTKPNPHQGLGLAIVSHIILQHEGKIEIESKENVGTTVFISMPF